MHYIRFVLACTTTVVCLAMDSPMPDQRKCAKKAHYPGIEHQRNVDGSRVVVRVANQLELFNTITGARLAVIEGVLVSTFEEGSFHEKTFAQFNKNGNVLAVTQWDFLEVDTVPDSFGNREKAIVPYVKCYNAANGGRIGETILGVLDGFDDDDRVLVKQDSFKILFSEVAGYVLVESRY